jgi:hypothetical protein
MSSILLPRCRQIHQPQGLFELDANNAFGVVAIAVPGLSASLSGAAAHVNNSDVTEGVGAGGVQYIMPAAKSAARFGSLGEFKPEPPFSVMFGFEPFTDSATGGFATSNESATNYAGWDFLSAGSLGGFRVLLRLGNNGGAGSANRADFAHTTRISLGPHVAGGVVRSVSDADVVLDDDWQTPTRNGSASSVVYATNEAAFGSRAATSMVAGAYEFLLVADRALSQDEWRELRDNPYQVVKARTRRLYFDIPSAGGTEVAVDAAIRWNMQAAVSTAASIRWSLQQPVQADATIRWSMLQPASADLIACWAMQSVVAADQSAAWNVLTSVEQSQTIAWKLLQTTQTDATLRWSMLEAVSGDITALWNIAATLGIVSADLALRWSALAPVTADASLHWHLLNAVARGIDLPWHVVQTIAADSALRWALVSAVQTDLTAAWRLVTTVSADSVLAWDMAAAVGVVAASLSLHWSVVARVQQSIDARWSLLASVGADADMRWDIVTGVMRELTARWEVVAQLVASASLDLAWSLVAVSETDLVMRWQVGEVFDLVVRKRFVAGASTRRVFVTGASTRRSFVA